MRSSGGGGQVLGVEELGVEEDQRCGGVAWMLAAQMRQRGRDGNRLDWARPWARLGLLGLFYFFKRLDVPASVNGLTEADA